MREGSATPPCCLLHSSLRPLHASLILVALTAAGCQPAARYPAPATSAAAKPAAPVAEAPPSPGVLWLAPADSGADIPIVFGDAASRPDEWRALPDFWNHFPPPAGGMRVAHVGQPPLQAALALVAMDRLEVIKLKVPLGLPDPTPYIPWANPPTYARWRLGKRLFFDRKLLPARDGGSCARCHDPGSGFTSAAFLPGDRLAMNPPSLLNCVYNRHQFWDGRATALEEVAFHDRAEKAGPGVARQKHYWPGLVEELRASEDYRRAFRQAFGITDPTEDAVAKALATYLRTILSGNSLHDRARRAAGKRKDGRLKQEDFEAVLDDAALGRLAGKDADRAATAKALWAGYRFFHGEAGCGRCHGGWAFTDGDFHNIGIRESDYLPAPGQEPGRFRNVPVGLKEARLIGAFRTPTLRNLPRTGPYFHDGSAETLFEAVQYYNRGVSAEFNRHLDPALLAGPGTARRPGLHDDDVRAIVLFLRALDGEPVHALVSQ